MPVRSLLALAALLLLAPAASAQDALAVGRPIADTVAVGGTQTYTLALDAGRFVAGVLDQHEADLVVTVTGPDGARVGRFDHSARGADPFQFETETAGTYRLEVTPFAGAGGAFTLTVARVEPLAATPEGRVDQLMARYSTTTPGAVVGVVRDGRLAFARGYGMADLTHGVPFTPETPTNIGSTSKQFTGFAVASLAAGRVDLDADVRTYLPELPDLGQTVTVRHLLTHTSGYREFLNTLALAGRRLDEGDHIGRAEVLDVVARQERLQNAPGAEFNYNNTAYALLATLVERVTGETFPDWLAANVFAPLGMTRSVVRATPGQIVPGRAAGYAPHASGGYRDVGDLGAAMGAGAIYTTVGDLARWMQNYATGAVGGSAVLGPMRTPYVLASGDTTGYGFGLMIDEWRGVRRVHHGGADAAHRSQLIVFPDLGGGVIVLSNDATFNADGTANTVAGLFFADALAPEAAATAPVAAAFDRASYDAATFDAFAGRYELDAMPGFVLALSREGNTLYVQATGQPRVTLAPTSDSTFAIEIVDAHLALHRDASGTVTGLTLHQGGQHHARRLPDEAVARPDLAAFAGRYYSAELDATYTLAVASGALTLRHRRFPEAIPLAHRAGDSFSGAFPVADVAFERDAAGRVTGLRVGNGRARDVGFVRLP